MRRREFVKMLVAAGVAAPMAPGWVRLAEASQATYRGDLLIFIHANGGWDPLQFCDPKGETGRGFSSEEIEVAGNLQYAPMQWEDVSGSGATYAYASDFFPVFHRRMVVVQGVDMQTNAHVAGRANAFQGSFSPAYPTLSAAFCAARAPSLLLGYLVTGDYRSTGGLVPYTPIRGGNLLGSIAQPNIDDPFGNNLGGRRMPQEVFEMIDAARRDRLERLLDDKTMMPRRRQMLKYFSRSIDAASGLEQLGNVLPPDGFQVIDEKSMPNDIVRQADIALHAMASGITAAVDMQFIDNVFDSHSNHAERQGRWLASLVYGIRFLWNRAEEIDARTGSGIANRLTVVIASEFGRAPHLNSEGGTGHWPTTSAIVMRKDFEANGVGDRVVGYSTNDGLYQPGQINPLTLERDESAGIKLTSAHFHKALREYLGIYSSKVLAKFDFPNVESVSMFTPGFSTQI